jgi:type II secretory pathway component GspD/PulD (secretin)
MMSRESGGPNSPGRNFSIYLLKHAAAGKAADTLQSLFRNSQQSGFFRGPNQVVIVPDDRVNAILVQASRTDRTTIENFLKIIDSEETPVAVGAIQPLTVQFQNAKATRIEQLLRTIFKSQLTSRNTTGTSSSSTSGLISTELTVDEVTNSLIITAPPSVAQRLAAFARSLDESTAENAREITIVPLKTTNAARLQKMLDLFIDDAPGARPRASHRP